MREIICKLLISQGNYIQSINKKAFQDYNSFIKRPGNQLNSPITQEQNTLFQKEEYLILAESHKIPVSVRVHNCKKKKFVMFTG